MDTSKKYIEMCRNKWIQGLWEPKVGDRCYNNLSDTVVYIWAFGANDTLMVTPEDPYNQGHLWLGPFDLTWLPRQDQLQGMVFDETVGLQSRCCAIYNFSTSAEESGGNSIIIDGSMEQLWLAFVMHEKFNKKWYGKEWINPS